MQMARTYLNYILRYSFSIILHHYLSVGEQQKGCITVYSPTTPKLVYGCVSQNMELMRSALYISLSLFKTGKPLISPKTNTRAEQQLRRANRASLTHVCGREHPFSSPRLRFWRSFGLAAVSLSPSNLIGKPQACHSVLAAHIWTNTLREKDTNLSVRWQRNDERGREALERGNIQCSRRHLSWYSS